MGALDGAFVDAIGAFVLGSIVGRGVAIAVGDDVGALDRGSAGALVDGVGFLVGAVINTIGALVLGSIEGRDVSMRTGDNIGAFDRGSAGALVDAVGCLVDIVNGGFVTSILVGAIVV